MLYSSLLLTCQMSLGWGLGFPCSQSCEKNSLKEREPYFSCIISSRMKVWIVIIAVCLLERITTLGGFYTSEEPAVKHTVNPECFLNVTETIQYHGYPSEEHHVETEDGYILTVIRIPHGRHNGTNKGSRPTIFLLHSVLGDASHWVSNLPQNSLGFILADAGYDVFLGNSRGNTYSLNHKTLNPKEQKFWEFSFHEMGYYDIPAVINFILKKTAQEQLYFIGHSEGSTAGFIAFSTRPKLAEKVKVFFALAPPTSIPFSTTPLTILARLSETTFRMIFGNKGLFQYPTFLRKPFTTLCVYHPRLCASVLFFVAGYNAPNLNMSRLDIYTAHNPAGTSVQNGLHWRQSHRTKPFRAYDYGCPKKNMEKYNQTAPLIYKIKNIKIPIAIWTGGQDFFVIPEDAAMLSSQISNLIYKKQIPEWEHLDFIWGLDAPERLYMDIIKIAKKFP
nr:PREDICTED: lysosomal acid lipase/cholesteryl ester hydrolase isoform X1 [Anolis carolinensis]|eukprot:XP_008114494.2 PREDICTED: lysosomal acid lipase/cholesteryl ester hydrolase isoform X1 [Anolis carolinensis]